MINYLLFLNSCFFKEILIWFFSILWYNSWKHNLLFCNTSGTFDRVCSFGAFSLSLHNRSNHVSERQLQKSSIIVEVVIEATRRNSNSMIETYFLPKIQTDAILTKTLTAKYISKHKSYQINIIINHQKKSLKNKMKTNLCKLTLFTNNTASYILM